MLNCQSKLKCFYWSESNPHILNVKLNISAFSLYGAIFIALALFITSLSSPSFPDLVSTLTSLFTATVKITATKSCCLKRNELQSCHFCTSGLKVWISFNRLSVKYLKWSLWWTQVEDIYWFCSTHDMKYVSKYVTVTLSSVHVSVVNKWLKVITATTETHLLTSPSLLADFSYKLF